MRLRRKPWIDEAIKDYTDILYLEEPTRLKGKWNTLFPEPENPIHVEFGTGKGNASRNASVALLPNEKHRNGKECSNCRLLQTLI